MKKLGKVLLIIFLVLIVLLVSAISFTIGWRPFIGPRSRALTDRKFDSTPARLERGQLLAHTAGCLFCHSPHEFKPHEAAYIPGREGSGEVLPFDGLPGKVVAPNLTPDRETGAGTWTDDQFARAIREGIGHDGRALFPMMPYQGLRHMSDEDLASIIVYLRSLPPVRNPLPKTELIFPVKYLIRTVPQPLTESVPEPDRSDQVKWGQYLVTRSGCNDCHTPTDRGQAIPNMKLAGGFLDSGPWGAAAAANITPDPSGISYYDQATFTQALRTGYVKARPLSPAMPFDEYKYLGDDELKAMFTYLHTIPPVHHRVDNSLPPTPCKLCLQKHGAGDQN